MARCIGFPICTEVVDDDSISCKKCWGVINRYQEGRWLRNEFIAAKRKFKGTKLYKDAKKKLEDYLHESLSFGQRKRENIRRYTIVG